ncbi:hypothetical protein DYB28_007543 [Aphanomyces astaci]|uniref:Peptidase M13 C-terminal domain-containing protein n=1 Tax=Aphanomyces astaci TaxID=112090 RepID=A0A9X8H7S3_APHAT|nr:hypothetical protein DYB28_007543 [Aphanomyces astaci]
MNQIVFRAAILQKPLFDGLFDASQNFGAIGTVIGHEITHEFDNYGRKLDGDGNLSPEVTGAVLGNISGQISLGETIADNGGLKTSFHAYH